MKPGVDTGWISGLKPGDQAAIHHKGTVYTIADIVRLTKTRIIARFPKTAPFGPTEIQFSKSTGLQIGDDRNGLTPLTQDVADEIRHSELCEVLRGVSWGSLPLNLLETIVRIIPRENQNE